MSELSTSPSVHPSQVDSDHAHRIGLDTLIDEEWLPLRPQPETSTETLRIAATDSFSSETQARLESEHGHRLEVIRISLHEHTDLLLAVFDELIATDSSDALRRVNPQASASTTFTVWQAAACIAGAVLVVVCAVLWPAPTLVVLLAAAGIAFLAATGFKFVVALKGAGVDVVEHVAGGDIAALNDQDLPVYTVLVPVYKEANIIGQLVGNLRELDYPEHKLEILVLVEADDDETRDAALASDPPENFRIITVPDGHPRTKPRACNVGLRFAKGQYLVIYDAEDRPDADQLHKAVAAFRRAEDSTVVLQASLSYFNARENWLTRMFTLEYNYWFYYMLAGLDALNLPIPLGGTSNHFRVDALRELGGWDPHNVTEDADLGIRASALGYRVGVINSTTMEEANRSVPNFLRQRSRWIKGYMQTVLVHARRPVSLMRAVGVIPFFAFLLLIGGTPLTFLLVIPFMLITGAVFVVPGLFDALDLNSWILWLGMVNFFIGSTIMVHLSMMGPYRKGNYRLVPWAALNPLYWVLHSLASYKALWQLVTRPHYWEKTHHGLTTFDHHDSEQVNQ